MEQHSEHTSHTKTYIAIWMVLLFLTVVTVLVSYVNFGIWNIVVAMLVATIKGSLVCLYFMHLKEDNRVNQVVFLSSFLFLAIFVGLTGADEFTRAIDKPVAVAKLQENIDLSQVLKPTPELLAHGKELHTAQCAVCHGSSGKGDGPGGAAANPKPRDFTSGYWKYSGGVVGITNTIAKGSPGTSMPAFPNLGVSDRFALAHYVRTFVPNPPEDKAADVEEAKKVYAGGGSSVKVVQKIPVSFAIKQMAEPVMTVEEGTNSSENASDD